MKKDFVSKIVFVFHCFKVCIIQDKYAVAGTEHDALVKSTTKIFSNFVDFLENSNFNSSVDLKKILIRAVGTVRIICYNFLPDDDGFLVEFKLNIITE